MNVWTVYYDTIDHPGKYVVRKFVIGKFNNEPTDELYVGDALDDVRAKIPFGLIRFSRSVRDDPVIVETWL